jgi:lipopolysaccharide export system protein LptA
MNFALFPYYPNGEAAGLETTKPQVGVAETITIDSDRMEMDQQQNTVVYMGNVVAVRGNVTMKSDTLTATYNPEMQRLAEVVAEGNLEVTQGNRIATGAKAIYNNDDNSIVLTGNPVIRQGNSQVSGCRIIMFINEERGVVEGGCQRVKAVIFPDDLGNQ